YAIAGVVSLDDVVAEIRDESSALLAAISLGPAPAGMLQWDGRVAGNTVLPGRYTITLDARSESGSFGKSAPHELTVYKLKLEPVGPTLGGSPVEVMVVANVDDDDADGVADVTDVGPVAGENDLRAFDVIAEPFGAELSARLRFDGGSADAAMFEDALKSSP